MDAISSGEPLIDGALIGLGLLLVAWLIAIIRAGDVEDGTEDVFSVASGILLGLASIAVVLVGELASLIAEAPGIASTAIAGALGWASLSGLVEIGPQIFAFLVVATLVGTIAMREA